MRIFQMLVTLVKGDAIGNCTLLLARYLRERHYQVFTYAYHLGNGLTFGKDSIFPIEDMEEPNESDVVLYHMCESTTINQMLQAWNCKKIAIYHNTTPPQFFAWLDQAAAAKQKESIFEISALCHTFDKVIAVSEFNKSELVRLGYRASDIEAIPILMALEDYAKLPNKKIIEKYQDGWTNILFVGRIAPNKKHEDIIRTFAWYKKHLNPKSRLILIGSPFSQTYLEYLKQYIAAIDVSDVILTGHLSFSEILGFYKVSDAFLCMSEHEGFCVPLVEAMLFDVPIIAYASSAIPETLGESGILLKRKDVPLAAKIIERLTSDPVFRNMVLEKQRARLLDFSPEEIINQIIEVIEGVCG